MRETAMGDAPAQPCRLDTVGVCSFRVRLTPMVDLGAVGQPELRLLSARVPEEKRAPVRLGCQ